MSGDCYFCHGIVFPSERDDVLIDHADHAVYMHRRCAAGYNALEATDEEGGTRTVVCPECGAAEQVEFRQSASTSNRTSDSSHG
jgi:hypothetical protein